MNWDFLIALTKAPRVFSVAVAAGMAVAVVWSLRLFGLPRIDSTGLTFAAIGTTALMFFVLSVSVHTWQTRPVRLGPLSKLSAQQLMKLKLVHSSGRREFVTSVDDSSQHWLMDLEERGYIKQSWVVGSDIRYQVTSEAWSALDKAFKN